MPGSLRERGLSIIGEMLGEAANAVFSSRRKSMSCVALSSAPRAAL